MVARNSRSVLYACLRRRFASGFQLTILSRSCVLLIPLRSREHMIQTNMSEFLVPTSFQIRSTTLQPLPLTLFGGALPPNLSGHLLNSLLNLSAHVS